MAEFMILIYDDEAALQNASPAELEQLMQGHKDFYARNGAAIRSGSALHPESTATSIRKDAAGSVSVTDGAFAETKEALGGFYVVEAADADEAVAIARQVPTLGGGVELRPFRVFE